MARKTNKQVVEATVIQPAAQAEERKPSKPPKTKKVKKIAKEQGKKKSYVADENSRLILRLDNMLGDLHPGVNTFKFSLKELFISAGVKGVKKSKQFERVRELFTSGFPWEILYLKKTNEVVGVIPTSLNYHFPDPTNV